MDSSDILGEVLVKSEDDVSLACGCKPDERPIRDYIQKGIIVLDKPSGPTSHQVTAWVRDIFKVKKAGHSGTLDPKVTGLLPIALGSATRLVGALLSSGKTYVGVMRIHDDITNKKVKDILTELTGPLYQRPPLKSAVKRELRVRTVYSNKVIEKNGKDVVFETSCEAGTYIRKLIHDAGLIAGCGAHMAELRRTRVGPFTEEDEVILHDVKDAYVALTDDEDEKPLRAMIHPMEDAVSHLKKIWLKSSAVGSIAHGSQLMVPGVTRLHDGIKKAEDIAFMTEKGEVAALAKALASSTEIMNAKKGIIAKSRRVVIGEDTYPRMWGDNK